MPLLSHGCDWINHSENKMKRAGGAFEKMNINTNKKKKTKKQTKSPHKPRLKKVNKNCGLYIREGPEPQEDSGHHLRTVPCPSSPDWLGQAHGC